MLELGKLDFLPNQFIDDCALSLHFLVFIFFLMDQSYFLWSCVGKYRFQRKARFLKAFCFDLRVVWVYIILSRTDLSSVESNHKMDFSF